MLDNLCVLQYKGGRCVEFLAGYLSTHQGFKQYPTVWHVETNTYKVEDPLREYLRHLYNVDIEIIKKHLDSHLKTITSTHYSASADQLMNKVALFKKTLVDQGAKIVVSHSKEHNLFFDCMLMIKHWFKVMPSGKKRWRDEFQDCDSVEQFLSATGLEQTGEHKFNRSLIKLGIGKILDLDKIFFEEDYTSWLEMLDYFDIKPKDGYQQYLQEYHRRNIELANNYSVPIGINTDNSWFKQWVIKHA